MGISQQIKYLLRLSVDPKNVLVGEVGAHIQATYGVRYSHSGCLKLLHRLGFEDKRPESLPAQADEAKQAAFIAGYETLLQGLAADELIKERDWS